MVIYIHVASNNSTIKRFTKFTSTLKSNKHVVTQKHLYSRQSWAPTKSAKFWRRASGGQVFAFPPSNRCPLLLAFVDFLVGFHCFRSILS
jgi:hypothetical protein